MPFSGIRFLIEENIDLIGNGTFLNNELEILYSFLERYTEFHLSYHHQKLQPRLMILYSFKYRAVSYFVTSILLIGLELNIYRRMIACL